jgi:hypothetical protein
MASELRARSTKRLMRFLARAFIGSLLVFIAASSSHAAGRVALVLVAETYTNFNQSGFGAKRGE